jgi:hypothetical protein
VEKHWTLPLVRRKPLSFTIDTEEGKHIVIDVPYSGAKDPTTAAYWDQLMYNNSYQAALQQLRKLWPEAAEVVPCLIEKEELPKSESGRVNRNKEYNLERAQRKIAESIAKTYQKYSRYSQEYKQDALDDLSEQIDSFKPLFQEFKCPKKTTKNQTEGKEEVQGAH